MRRLAVLLAGLVLLAGCTAGSEPVPPYSDPPADPAAIVAARKAAGIADCPAVQNLPAVADGLPDLVLDCLGGDSTVMLSGLRGKPMVINLWAQWCEPCRAESPYLRQFQAAAKGKVLLLGVNYADPRPELAVEFASLVGWKYPQLADPEHRLGPLIGLPTAMPMTLFVAADGRIVRKFIGGLHSYDELVQLTRDELGVKL